jgi:hypothetical protein
MDKITYNNRKTDIVQVVQPKAEQLTESTKTFIATFLPSNQQYSLLSSTQFLLPRHCTVE